MPGACAGTPPPSRPRGYLVGATDFHGSIGYGQKFKEQISGDWGGPRLRRRDARYGRRREAAVRRSRSYHCAAGASFGGYMVDWIAGHTDRFKCLVSHDGVFDLVSEYGSTEELWFPEWSSAARPGRPGAVPAPVAQQLRPELQDPDAGRPGRAGFPRTRRAGPGDVHRTAAARDRIAAALLPRRRPLGPQTENSQLWYPHGARLDRRARPAGKQAGLATVGREVWAPSNSEIE